MTTQSPGSPPPDDDPGFARWIEAVGPMREMPDEVEVGRPVVAAIAVLGGLAVMVAALGWAALGLAVRIGGANTTAAVLLTVGTVAVLTGCVLAYVGNRRRR